MNDMTPVIVPRSDQISSDDFIAGSRTYTIEGVSITPGTEQPVQIKLVNEDRVWKPCKSVSRVLVAAWGPDASAYTGRSVTLYRDPHVKWGGMEVGGIRISHMSHIERDMLIQLTATKGKRAPTVIKPLVAEVKNLTKQRQTAEQWAADHIAAVQDAETLEALSDVISNGARPMGKLETEKPDLWTEVSAAYAARRAQIEAPGKPDADMGEGFTDAADWEA
jgi:phage host-nuclease inhibitor protein Gam